MKAPSTLDRRGERAVFVRMDYAFHINNGLYKSLNNGSNGKSTRLRTAGVRSRTFHRANR
jgi:hypothetical protein